MVAQEPGYIDAVLLLYYTLHAQKESSKQWASTEKAPCYERWDTVDIIHDYVYARLQKQVNSCCGFNLADFVRCMFFQVSTLESMKRA